MSDEQSRFDLESPNGAADSGRGFVALAVIAAAVGAGAALLFAPEEGARTRRRVGRGLRSIGGEAAGTIAQLQQELRRRKNQSRRDKQLIGLAGLLIGAGIAAVLNPQSGPATRERLAGSLGRIRVGAVDRISRLRRKSDESEKPGAEAQDVRSVQELGRDPNTVF
jgi:gas vesicle protein